MKRLIFLSCFLSAISVADTNLPKDIEVVKQDIAKTGVDIWVLFEDAGRCLANNVPSVGTLAIDGAADALLRQYEPFANFIKALEKKNPVNGAIVRDISKTATVAVKIHYQIPVDQTGRLYDKADLYAQMTKVLSKAIGFAGLYACGGLGNSVALFVVNNGGDVLSQAVLDSGKTWRKNQTLPFEEYLVEDYSIKNSIVSIPAKGGVSYVVGALIQKLSIIEAAELATLVVLNQVVIKKNIEAGTTMGVWANKHPFTVGFLATFVVSGVKSLWLTTTCKSAVEGVNYYLSGLTFSMPNWFGSSTTESAPKKADEL